MPQKHMLDQVAEEAADWADRMVDQLVELLTKDTGSPFRAQASEKQKLDYYQSQFFLPDNTPNNTGRQAQMQRLGPEAFAQTLLAVTKQQTGESNGRL